MKKYAWIYEVTSEGKRGKILGHLCNSDNKNFQECLDDFNRKNGTNYKRNELYVQESDNLMGG